MPVKERDKRVEVIQSVGYFFRAAKSDTTSSSNRSIASTRSSTVGRYAVRTSIKKYDTTAVKTSIPADKIPFLHRTKTSWVLKAKEEIESLTSLPDDWNGYNSKCPNTKAATFATLLLDEAFKLNLQPNRISPSAEGGIAISYFNQNKYADIECLNNGKILAVKTGKTNETEVWEVSTDANSLSCAIIELSNFVGGA
jgi:hypothetical protein